MLNLFYSQAQINFDAAKPRSPKFGRAKFHLGLALDPGRGEATEGRLPRFDSAEKPSPGMRLARRLALPMMCRESTIGKGEAPAEPPQFFSRIEIPASTSLHLYRGAVA
jgi:hypothetical protein